MNRDNIHSVVVYLFILQFLMLNWGIERIGSIIHQTTEWESFCWRGIVLIFVGIIMFWVSKKAYEKIFYYAIITTCLAECVYGLCQVYGFVSPINTVYKLTGTFYNSGPLGGYIALGIVIAVSEYLNINSKDKWKKAILEIAILIMLCVLFATLSRTAWISTIVGLIWVFTRKIEWKQTILRYKKHFIWGGLFCVCLLFFVVYFKWQSALGRFFLWRMSWRAMMNSPIIGNDSFEKAYGQALESYFSKECYEDWEVSVCDNTDKSFCEYLNFGVHYGVIALIALVVLLCIILWLGIRQKQHGLVGLQLTIMCFAIASYPMRFPAFVAIESIIICSIVLKNANRWTIMSLSCLMIGLMCNLGIGYNQEKMQIKDMEMAHKMYTSAQYLKSANLYQCVEKQIPNMREYWYEYGHSLHKIGKWNESTRVLFEADKYNMDPMTLNLIGKNMIEVGNYEEAEKCYKQSINRLPNRMYPHYLLFHLYSTEEYRNDELREKEADIIITKKFKVESSATKQMRNEVKALIQKDI